MEGGASACRNGFMQAWSFICDLSCGYLNGKPIAPPFGAIDFPTFVLCTAEDAISADSSLEEVVGGGTSVSASIAVFWTRALS